jgi:hypothetical protein
MSEKELYNQLEEYDKTVIKLSKENERLKEDLEAENSTSSNLARKIIKTITLTEELYKMEKEQDSDNVNLIDRLENILKTLKGE